MASKAVKSYTCSSCRGEFKFEGVRYGYGGKGLFCDNCFNREKKRSEKLAAEKEAEASAKREESVKVRCLECNYKFNLKANQNPICPYCSGERLMKDNTTAQMIVDSV